MDKEQALLQMDDNYRPVFERVLAELGTGDNKQAYMMLAAYGYLMKTPATDFNKKYSVTRTSYLNDEERALIAAMAMESGTSEPPSMSVALQLTERYANGGVQLISELLDSPLGFPRAFAQAVEQARREWESLYSARAQDQGVGVELASSQQD